MLAQSKSFHHQTQQLEPLTFRSKLASETFPNNIDFGFCPVGQQTTKYFVLSNPSPTEKQFSFEHCPFHIEPAIGRLLSRTQANISITHQPHDATVLVASTVLHIIGEPDRVVKISAIGKYPFITINTSKLNYESLIVGKREVKEIVIKNQSPVNAVFNISRVEEDNFKDSAFALDYYHGEIPPKASFLVRITYSPSIVDLISCSHFNINCSGGNVVDFECKGVASGVDVSFNQKSINFGEIKLGQQISRLLVLQNNSDIPTQFQVFNDKRNVFSFSPLAGTINPRTTSRLIVQFNPPTTMTYYERAFCIVKNHQLLYVDLIGTCYDLLIRPKPILQRSIDLFRRRVIAGQYEKEDLVAIKRIDTRQEYKDRSIMMTTNMSRSGLHNPQADTVLETHGSNNGDYPPASPAKDASPLLDHQALAYSVNPIDMAVDAPSQVILHKELFQEAVSMNRLIGLSTDLLDFGFAEAFTLSQTLEIELTNNLSWRVSIYWNLPKERLDSGDEIPIFNIFPLSKIIKPNTSERFSVTFRPHKNSFYFFQQLQFFAIRYDPKHTDNLLKTKGKRPGQDATYQLNMSKIRSDNDGYNNNQSLVLEDELQPPISGVVNCVGHSFSIVSQPFIPILDVLPSNRVIFQPCSIGESVYATVHLVNKTDTPTYFRFSPDVNRIFRAYPTCGLVEGKAFQVIIMEFSPSTAKIYAGSLSCSLNHNLSEQLTFKLLGYCCEPKLELQNEGQIFFPPSFTGVMSRQNFKIHNHSRIPLEYTISIPQKYENELYIDPSVGVLKPNELTYLKCSFIPYRKKNYKITCPIVVRDIANPQQTLVGYFEPGSGTNLRPRRRQEVQYKIETFGVGGDGSLSLEPQSIDFGIVKVDFNNKQYVTLENFSNINFYVEINIQPKDEKLKNDPKLRNLINKSFQLDFGEGIIAGNSKLEIGIVFQPTELGEFDLTLECAAKERNLKGVSKTNKKIYSQKAAIDIKAKGSYPQLKFVDVRNDSTSVSTLWENFSVNKINHELLSELSESEKKYNEIETLTMEEAASLQKELCEFDWKFGYLSNKKPIRPRKVVITIQNIGGTPLDWRFKQPSDNQIEVEPWADPGEPTPEEAFEKEMVERQIFTIEPRSGILPAGEFKDIALYYSPGFEDKPQTSHSNTKNKSKAINEEHFLKVVFQVKNGKAIGLNLRGMTLAPLQGLLALRKTEYKLPSVPIGSLVPATFPIEIVNAGSGKINYHVDLSSVNSDSRMKTSNKIFDIIKPEGLLGPNEKSYLQCQFKPLEAKLYEFEVPIIVSDFVDEIQRIPLIIRGHGYNVRPPREIGMIKEEIPTQRSFVSSIGSKAFFSIEEIDFGELESQKPEYRLLLLYNAHDEKRLMFDFHPPRLTW